MTRLFQFQMPVNTESTCEHLLWVCKGQRCGGSLFSQGGYICIFIQSYELSRGFPGDTGNASSISGSGRSLGVGNGNPLQCSCLENSTDTGAWRTTVHRATKSDVAEHVQVSLTDDWNSSQWEAGFMFSFLLNQQGPGNKAQQKWCHVTSKV